MRIGLFGGSFDPVHNGHLALAEKAVKELKLDKIIFIPAFKPPHKKRVLAGVHHRIAMLKIALKGSKKYAISEYEVKKKDKVYTYQTLKHFRKIYPKAELHFLIGTDSMIDFRKWKHSDELPELCRFIVGKRKGYNSFNLNGFTVLKGTIPNISSSAIRVKVKKHEELSGLVPNEIEEYIKKEGLYLDM